MSVQSLAWAWRQNTGSPLKKLLLIILSDQVDDRGRANFDPEDVAYLAGCDVGSANLCVIDLESDGLLSITHNGGVDYRWEVSLNFDVERPVFRQ